MIIVLLGRSASGKSTAMAEIEKYGIKRIVTLTTRPPREGEVDGIDYRFVSNEEFLKRLEAGEFAESYRYDTVFGPWYYGSLMEDYNDCQEDLAIILTPEGLKNAKEAIAANFKSFYIFVRKDELKNRLLARGDDPREIERRMASDDEKFNGFKADFMVKGTPQQIAETIMHYSK